MVIDVYVRQDRIYFLVRGPRLGPDRVPLVVGSGISSDGCQHETRIRRTEFPRVSVATLVLVLGPVVRLFGRRLGSSCGARWLFESVLAL
jgi:hypothetical protein